VGAAAAAVEAVGAAVRGGGGGAPMDVARRLAAASAASWVSAFAPPPPHDATPPAAYPPHSPARVGVFVAWSPQQTAALRVGEDLAAACAHYFALRCAGALLQPGGGPVTGRYNCPALFRAQDEVAAGALPPPPPRFPPP
jgi:hypothetical protein